MVMKVYDVIVVGFGVMGGWLVKVMIEVGMEVLMFEVGELFDESKDFWQYILLYDMLLCG